MKPKIRWNEIVLKCIQQWEDSLVTVAEPEMKRGDNKKLIGMHMENWDWNKNVKNQRTINSETFWTR